MTGITLINYCGHDIDIMTADGRVVSIPPSGSMIRLVVSDVRIGEVPFREWQIPLFQERYHDSKLLPPRVEGVLYIVPKLVATVYSGVRDDFIYPDTKGATWRKGTTIPEYVPGLRFPATLMMKSGEEERGNV